jgi:ribosomal protein S18 acetylase RimI-like enzyme
MIAFEPAREADVPQMVELLALLFEQEAEFRPDGGKQATALKMILSEPARGRIYVAREGRRVVAMASLLFTVSTVEGGKAAWFEDLVVHPDYRQQGTGEKMLAYVIGEARKEGVLRITLLTDMQNERAQALYRRAGFVGSPMRPMRLKLKGKA